MPGAALFLDAALLTALLQSILGSSITLGGYRIALRRDDDAVDVVTLARDVVVSQRMTREKGRTA